MNSKRTMLGRLAGLLRRPYSVPQLQGVLSEANELVRLAQKSGQTDRCGEGQRRYHIDAESAMEVQWQTLILPLLQGMDFSVVVDLAAGYGRNTVKLLEHAGEVIVVDINRECIEYCQRRFANDKQVKYLHTDGASLKGIADSTVTLMYSFDAMVHFDSDVVRAYLLEFVRVLRPGGRCFCHHSNFVERPGGTIEGLPHSRNFMSAELFAHYSLKAGLSVRQQRILDWGGYSKLDCISILEKPLA